VPKTIAEKLKAEKPKAAKPEMEKSDIQNGAAEKAAAEKIAIDKAAAEKATVEKAAAEKAAAEKAAAEKAIPAPAVASVNPKAPAQIPAEVPAEVSSKIVVRAKTDSWIQIRNESGNLVMTRILRAGDSYAVPPTKGLQLMTGNAGALEILVDGTAVPPIGPFGAVRRGVSLDADNLRKGPAPAP
jgi:cytoskeleton protein RodZ